MASILIPVAVLAAVYGALALIAWRRPLLGRLALREAIRRPGQSALLVGGMMFGTAAILGMQGVYDTLDRVNTDTIYASWGRVDITVTQGGQPFSQYVAGALAVNRAVAAGAAGVESGYQLVGSAADLDERLSTAPTEIIGLDPAVRGFYQFPLSDDRTSDGSSLQNGQAIITSTLARRLDARLGDRIQLDLAVGNQGGRLLASVAGITRQGAFGVIGSQPGIFLRLDDVQQAVGAGTVNIIRVSARGDGQAEVDRARSLTPAVERALAELSAGGAFQVHQVKAEDLAASAKAGSAVRPGLLAISLFVVLAATALVVNLTLALAEERRPRLAVLQALGLTRTGLVGAALLEGGLYSLTAALVGILPGLAYTYYLDARPLPGSLGSGLGIHQASEVFTVSGTSIALSVCLGALITLVTILVVSVRTSRMAISSAIRDLPEPPPTTHRSWFRTAWPLAIGLAGAAAAVPNNLALRLLAGSGVIVAASRLIPERLPARLRSSLMGIGLIVWAVAWVVASAAGLQADTAIPANLAAVLVCVFGAAILISANMRLLEPFAAAFSARLAAVLRPPLAYLGRRPIRSGLATGTVALVLAALTWFAVVITTVAALGDTTGGYDVRVTTLAVHDAKLPADLQSQLASQETLTTLAYAGQVDLLPRGRATSGWQSRFVSLYLLTDEQLARAPFQLSVRDPGYASDQAAWQAIRDNPDLVVAAGGGGGDVGTIALVGRNGVRRLRVIGDLPGLMLGGDQIWSGLLGSQAAFSDFALSGAGATVLIKLRPGVDARTFARQLRQETFGQGVDAVAYTDLIAENDQAGNYFVSFFTLLLQTGVVVGVLSLGILALRAAIERRRTIGILRALGYRPAQVLGGLLVEAMLTATVGIAVGIGAGLSLGLLLERGQGNVLPQVDAAQFLVPAALIYAAVLLVTIGPAIQASRLPTSEALRIVG